MKTDCDIVDPFWGPNLKLRVQSTKNDITFNMFGVTKKKIG